MTGTPTPDEFAGALAARVTHDIAGALSGLSAALSMLDEPDPSIREEAAGLARQAMDELEARLALCRAAYGRSAETTDQTALGRLIERLFGPGRGSVAVSFDAAALRAETGQAVLALAQIAASACAAGGAATLQVRGGERWACTLDAEGPRVRLGAEARAGLAGEKPPEGPAGRWALGAFARSLCRRSGGGVTIVETATGFQVTAGG
ncbi:MAG TPA: histidine phosphotransferase family protein [Caulobacteraceae bacterium]|jgi:histidine phosphotransferase ChpT|nr:histidine phosphotransferase family protein [Caulobacteraceae bacterium]